MEKIAMKQSMQNSTQIRGYVWLALFFTATLAGCGGGGGDSGSGGGGGGSSVTSVDDIVVPASFTYATDKTITLSVSVKDAAGAGYSDVTVNVYDGKETVSVPADVGGLDSEDATGDQSATSVTDDHLLMTGQTGTEGAVDEGVTEFTNVKIPAYVTTLYVTASAMGFNAVKEVDLSAVADNDTVEVALAAD